MRGKEKRAYEELSRIIRDKNKVERKQRGLDRMIQKTRRIKKLRKELPAQEKCSKCGKTIVLESPDAKPMTIKDKPVCKDCWCKKFGNEIEKHPIMDPEKLRKPKEKQTTQDRPQCGICGGVHTGECTIC